MNSNEIVIGVVNVGKKYKTGLTHARSMHDVAARWTRRLLRRPEPAVAGYSGRSGKNGPPPGSGEEFWALKDISFEIRRGEVVGIIGRNGAGKSTLLKILSQITKPTTGRATIYGRVGSLLEVGTGFHPELTGRENVYMNGCILGMTKREIDRKFDAIVDFAGVGKFIDTPVKRYSSGMNVRLGFAVAAHLEPEILIVDEVLAVGDATFQKRCLAKMEEVGTGGRTVLFVSHNMAAVTRLCPRTVLLDEGKVVADGPSYRVVGSYLHSETGSIAERVWSDLQQAPGNDIVRLRAVRVCSEAGDTVDACDIRQPVGIAVEYEVLQSGHVLVPNFHFFNDQGTCVFVVSDQDPNWQRVPRPQGRFTSMAWIPGNLLAEGTMVVGAAVSTMDPVIVHFFERDVVAFQVVDSLDGNSARGQFAGTIPGVIRPLLRWTTEFSAAEWHGVAQSSERIR